MSRDDDLRTEGWIRRFLACEPRLSEAVELYERLGYEVHLEALPDRPDEEDCGECRICFEPDRERYRTIYTRKARDGNTNGPLE